MASAIDHQDDVPFGQLLFDQTQQMPISRHHVRLGLLTVSRVVVDDVDAQRKLVVPYDVHAVYFLIALFEILKGGGVKVPSAAIRRGLYILT